MSWGDLAVVSVLIVLWTAISGRAEQIGLTAPMVFAIGGLTLGGEHALRISLSASSIKVTAELTLVLILFTDAARLRLTSLRHDMGLSARLLGIGLPLTIVLGALFAEALFSVFGGWSALLVAACLAPTDAGLGAGIVTNSTVPSRVRRALNVESGLNDGIVAPLVSVAVAVIIGQSDNWSSSLLHALREIGVGALIGVGVGLVTGWLLGLAVRRGWTEPGTAAIATPAAAIGTYALAIAVHGNGFVGAFLAGLCFGIFRHEVSPRALDLTEGAGQLLACLVWFAFGAAMLRPSLSDPDLLRCLSYAAASLTVVRMVPVFIALHRTRLGVATSAFIGWFGPRGLASVIFALLASEELGHQADTLVNVVSITVACSVVVHGLSANPLIARYSRMAKRRQPDHPLSQDSEVPTARRSFGSIESRGVHRAR